MLLSLKDYKDYKGMTTTNQDTEIIAAIAAVNVAIPSYCNRTFVDYYDTDKVEYFDATQSEYFPKEFPIVIITSIKTSTAGDEVYDVTLTEHTDYVLDDDASRLIARGYDSFAPNAKYQTNSGELTYKAGFENYPEDLVLAAVLYTEYIVSQDYVPRKSLAGASKDSVIIPDLTARMPAHIRRILEHYRAMVL